MKLLHAGSIAALCLGLLLAACRSPSPTSERPTPWPAPMPSRVTPRPITTTTTVPNTTTTTAAPAATGTALLQADDLQLIGSFTVPDLATGDGRTLAYSGNGLAFNAANNSLFITGHRHHQQTAEITIPTTVGSGPADQLPRSSIVQPLVDATNGKLPLIAEPREDSYATIGGYLVVDDQLVISGYHYYDAAGTQTRSHLVADTDLTRTSDPFVLSSTVPPRWLGGPMARIPDEWQARFGGDQFLTGLGGVSIAGNSSVGPAAASFSRATLDGSGEATLVTGYPLSAPLDGPEQQSDLWNLTSEVRGIVFPSGTNTVLFVGTHGTGPYCYGTGEACNDAEQPYQGTHAAPYRYQVWAYRAEDLAEVHAGIRQPHEVAPYDIWDLDLPLPSGVHVLTGVAHDPATGRIFLGQGRADGDLPVIHVYEARPAATTR